MIKDRFPFIAFQELCFMMVLGTVWTDFLQKIAPYKKSAKKYFAVSKKLRTFALENFSIKNNKQIITKKCLLKLD